MSGFSELIKSFDKTRDYIRDFFIYGFKVRSEFDRKSARTYDDEKRRIESWLGDYFQYDTTERGKQVSISVDSGHIHENPLYRAFFSKSFTDNDIRLHFLLMDVLSDGKALNVKALTTRLTEEYGVVFEEQTVRNKLKEYAKEGYFLMEKVGRTDMFRLTPDTAESFLKQYDGLIDAVAFFSEESEFGVIGNFLLHTMYFKNDIFLIKHNYIVHTLEDEILLQLIQAMEEKRFISLINFKKSGTASENYGIPLEIRVSTQTGRRYIVLYLPKYQRFNSIRLDAIKTVKAMAVCPEYDDYLEMLEKNRMKCFGVSFGDGRTGKREYHVKITFQIDEKTEHFLVERLEREKRCGTVEHISKNCYTYTVTVFDSNELMHWVKSFIGRIISIEGLDSVVEKRFYNDIQEMYQTYCLQPEGETNESIS